MESSSSILEDTQQLYDWGIENRLDQYYYNQDNAFYHSNHYSYPDNNRINVQNSYQSSSPENNGSGDDGFARSSIKLPTKTVDVGVNELLKVERKRARNRVAASKCRLRKLERINILDHQASQLRSDNNELESLSSKLKTQIQSLKDELQWHIEKGCLVWPTMDHGSTQPKHHNLEMN